MNSRKITNLPASVKARLQNLARQRQWTFDQVLQYYGMERFLFRLSESQYHNQFILKGALLFHVWEIQDSRATRDIDMEVEGDNIPEYLITVVQDICRLDVSSQDGVLFCAETVTAEIMQSQREYEGVRVCFEGRLENSKIPMQLDCGFGDVVTPEPQNILYPTLLDLPAPNLRGYPPDTVLSEKIQTMAEKGLSNSRVKDYYDVWMLLQQEKFEARTLWKAMINTFKQRNTVELDVVKLDQVIREYGDLKEHQGDWERFRKKYALANIAPQLLTDICSYIANFIKQKVAGAVLEGDIVKCCVSAP